MSTPKGALIAVDGIDAAAVLAVARATLRARGRGTRGGLSRWDASGVFEELAVSDHQAGAPSARTLLLLYAADLAFRLRWEIRPSQAEGGTVVAAPYVDTAIAFGRAAGIPAAWLTEVFRFAPRPTARHAVVTAGARAARGSAGFVEFGCAWCAWPPGVTRRQLVHRAARHLRAAARRRATRIHRS
jgi:hypothetical protein